MFVGGDALHFHPRSDAKTVRMHADGSLTTSSGPFSQAAAVSWAQKARLMIGANEVRQIWD
jgi:hypothetical protein